MMNGMTDRYGLDAHARERALDAWLRGEVLPAYDALKATPSRARSPDAVRAAITQIIRTE